MINPAPDPAGPLELRRGTDVVGVIVGQVLRRVCAGRRHMLRRPPAWAIDLAALDYAEQAGCVEVVVVDVDDNDKEFRASIVAIRTRGFFIDRGHGKQIALPLHGWQSDQAPAPAELV